MSARQPFMPQKPTSNHQSTNSANANGPKTSESGPHSPQASTESQSHMQQNSLDLSSNRPLNLTAFTKSKNKPKDSNKADNSQLRTDSPMKSRRSFEGIHRPTKAIFTKPRSPASIKSRVSIRSQNQNEDESVSPFVPTAGSTLVPTASPRSRSTVSSAPVSISAFKPSSSFNFKSQYNTANTDAEEAHIPAFIDPFVNNTRPTKGWTLTGNNDSYNGIEEVNESQDSRLVIELEPSLEPPASNVGVSNLSFGVSVSGGTASLDTGIDTGISEFTRSKRRHVGDDEKEGSGANETRNGEKTQKKQRGNVELVNRASDSSYNPSRFSSNPLLPYAHHNQTPHNIVYRSASVTTHQVDREEADSRDELNSNIPNNDPSNSHQNMPASTRQADSASDATYEDRHQDSMPTLDSILELDLQVYIDRHMEEYDTEKLKWSTCEMDEWVKGADELTSEYASLMKFVTEHMSTKLKVFASLNQKVEDQRAILGQRAKVLEEVQKGLVNQSGGLI